MRRAFVVMGGVLFLVRALNVQAAPSDADRRCAALCEEYTAKFKPLFIAQQRAWWDANITGTEAAYARKQAADQALIDLHADGAFFARIQSAREAGHIADPLLGRQLDVMYRSFLENQADPAVQKRIVALQNEVDRLFNNHRPRLGDRPVHENDLRGILAKTADSAEAEAAWKAYMDVGAAIGPRLAEMARLRNDLARKLGYRNYHALSLFLQELDETEFSKLFDELDVLTRGPYARLKAEIDGGRAGRFHIAATELRPWHYGDFFFQELPAEQQAGLEEAYTGADPVALSRRYYAGLGLAMDDILARSDLYEKPGKCPHGYGTDMDRSGDVRVIANLKPNLYWSTTMMHEAGHAIYYKYICADLPFLLRDVSHPMTTEGIAQMFGAATRTGPFLTGVLGLPADRANRLSRSIQCAIHADRLVFSRWSQVMVRFEQGLYADPEQDLAKLWSDLRRQYQLLAAEGLAGRPDYAAKFHLFTNPVYYHNYLMGELFAAQIRHHLLANVAPGRDAAAMPCGHPEAGEYLRRQVFEPGNRYSWRELITRATGEPLTARYFAEESILEAR
ncbi:MAG TPA: M2 family metallopeptidase [Phycisphaerae bacterium]|nr:M2 family metallopeptidase [Phycisphaerae bacterium]HRY68271.1 M2 family metallopeptidase [Phycisphaerae bacterium]HSA26846.1 M2 family metallopeptidase [Phycisphaerae bacterium]